MAHAAWKVVLIGWVAVINGADYFVMLWKTKKKYQKYNS
jgi:hypothetical protein